MTPEAITHLSEQEMERRERLTRKLERPWMAEANTEIRKLRKESESFGRAIESLGRALEADRRLLERCRSVIEWWAQEMDDDPDLVDLRRKLNPILDDLDARLGKDGQP